jgi:molybdate transport system permease protein
MGFPLLVRAVRLSIEAIDRNLEAAAATLGAGRAWAFLTVTLPLALPGVITGALLSFARSLGEFGATITFVSNIPGETRTLPLAIYTYTQTPNGDAQALRLSVLSVVLSCAALITSELLVRRARAQVTGDDYR